MNVHGQNSNWNGFGGAAAANQSPVHGPKRSEQRIPGAPPSGRPGSPVSRPEAVPVWLAALIAASCQAFVNGTYRAVDWHRHSGRAFYTNRGLETEVIHPLGIHLDRGDTLAVSWTPGESEYTFEVLRNSGYCA